MKKVTCSAANHKVSAGTALLLLLILILIMIMIFPNAALPEGS
jgi:hypothetical protein